MDIFIKNTLTQEKELFKPIKEGVVSMYQCGPTLYWYQHIGNLRSVVLADFIVRTLKTNGYDVNFVRNYTDVGHLSGDNEGNADAGEDRMIKASERENKKPEDIAKFYRQAYEKDIVALNTIKPKHTPQATDYIRQMQEMIIVLLAKGFAYTTPLAVYFDISKAKDYTRLSGQKIEDLIANSGHGSVNDSDKKNPGDFALWFFKAGKHSKAIQTWRSPFVSELVDGGEGFPGWHIECSAMIKDTLGDTIDIHMGGIEHIPIHHTNEIAQSESANGDPFVNYWVHNEHLQFEGKKMSKSEGTSFNLEQIESKGYNPLVLRYFFAQAHYRSKQNFTWEAIEAAKVSLGRLRESVNNLPEGGCVSSDDYDDFIKAINDDFNIPQGLAVVQKILKSDISDADKKATIVKCDEVLGLDLDKTFITPSVIPDEVSELAEQRDVARKNKDWQKADELRDQIEKMGFSVKDDGEKSKVFKV